MRASLRVIKPQPGAAELLRRRGVGLAELLEQLRLLLRRHADAAVGHGVLEVGEDHGLPVTRFPLAETAAAHDAVEAGTVGKVLLDL